MHTHKQRIECTGETRWTGEQPADKRHERKGNKTPQPHFPHHTAPQTEERRTNKLDGALGLDGCDGLVDIRRDDVTAVEHAARHVLAVARVALDHLVGGLEDLREEKGGGEGKEGRCVVEVCYCRGLVGGG